MQNMPKNHSDSPLHPFMVELKKLLPEKLTAVIDYYEILIDILQNKMPQRITFTDDERAKISVAAVNIKNTYGQSLFAKIKHLVQPDTILKWYLPFLFFIQAAFLLPLGPHSQKLRFSVQLQLLTYAFCQRTDGKQDRFPY